MDNYLPTPLPIVQEMLKDLKPGEVHYELGSGDGRFVVEATKLGAVSTGFELDEELVRKTKHLGNIVKQDYMTVDFSKADVITAFLDKMYEEVVEKFKKEAKVGARLVLYVNNEIICLQQ